MNVDKELIRHWLKSKRMVLEPGTAKVLSDKINMHLMQLLNWEAFKNVHCYEPIDSLKEVDTQPFRQFLSAKSVQVVMQDKSPSALLPDIRYDLIIVPTLGFDGRGNRIGWGGGYYDRLLATQNKALKLGLCYQIGFVAKGLPKESHDIPLDIIITEEKVYKFSK